jgi:hypothetical protein
VKGISHYLMSPGRESNPQYETAVLTSAVPPSRLSCSGDVLGSYFGGDLESRPKHRLYYQIFRGIPQSSQTTFLLGNDRFFKKTFPMHQ